MTWAFTEAALRFMEESVCQNFPLFSVFNILILDIIVEISVLAPV